MERCSFFLIISALEKIPNTPPSPVLKLRLFDANHAFLHPIHYLSVKLIG